MPILKFWPNSAYGPDMVPITPTLMTSATAAVPVIANAAITESNFTDVFISNLSYRKTAGPTVGALSGWFQNISKYSRCSHSVTSA